MAMIILTLVSTVAAAMVWQQSQAIHVEAAERARAQAVWMLTSGIDFGREVVRRDATSNVAGQRPWDFKLAEMRLSALLAADRDNTVDASLDAFFSGHIEDAQSRYNLRNLIQQGKVAPAELVTLQRLCDAIGIPGTADVLAAALQLAWAPAETGAAPGAAIAPSRVEQLAWLGIDPDTLAKLGAFVEILPQATPINLNSAPREVIYAVLDGLSLADADRLVRKQDNRFKTPEEAKQQALVPPQFTLDPARVGVDTNYFRVTATVRYEDRSLTHEALLQRQGTGSAARVMVLRRQRKPAAGAG